MTPSFASIVTYLRLPLTLFARCDDSSRFVDEWEMCDERMRNWSGERDFEGCKQGVCFVMFGNGLHCTEALEKGAEENRAPVW
ncbi:hypothetical protein BT69DRAFT_1285538 [Atractiella rhizophila]|nr:hypothetical protein BT69DRAFT_1285538 [Atractiella rhizophila]